MKLDSEVVADVVVRLKRAQGQIGGIINMIEDGRDGADLITRVAAVSRAADRVGFKIISNGLKQCIHAEDAGSAQALLDRAQLEKLFLTLA